MRRIEVFLTFPSLNQLASTQVPIYTPRSATRSPKCLKDEVVSLKHNLMKKYRIYQFYVWLSPVSQRKCEKIGKHLTAQLHQSGG